MRTSVYVDGFNLYNGARELVEREGPGVSWKWLDLEALARKLVPRDDIGRIRYFTARVKSTAHDRSLAERQAVYLRALETRSSISVHYGQFVVRRTRLPLARQPGRFARAVLRGMRQPTKVHPDTSVSIDVIRTEEKGSDVNLASYLLFDAFSGDFDKAVVISNDTDLCEPIRLVITELDLPVVVVNPRGHLNPARKLLKVASAARSLRVSALTESQLPETLADGNGTITRPGEW